MTVQACLSRLSIALPRITLCRSAILLVLLSFNGLAHPQPQPANPATTNPPTAPIVTPDEVQRALAFEDKDGTQKWDAIRHLNDLVRKNTGRDMTVFAPATAFLADHAKYLRSGCLASDTLVAIGDPAVPKLLERIRTTDSKSEDAWRTRTDLQVLARIRPGNVGAAGIIAPFLYNAQTSLDAVDCLLKLDPQAAAPLIEEALRKAPEDYVAIEMHAALATIPGKAPEHVAALAGYLKEKRHWELGYFNCAKATRRLGELGPLARDAWPQLLERARAGDSLAAWALGRIGADSPQVIAALIEMLQHAERDADRQTAAGALGDIGPASTSALPALEEAIKRAKPDRDMDEEGWWVAVEALGRIGGPRALPALRTALKSEDRDVRETAHYQITRIEKGSAVAGAPPRIRVESETQMEAAIAQLGDPATRRAAMIGLIRFSALHLYESGSVIMSSGDAKRDDQERRAASTLSRHANPETILLALQDPDRDFRFWGIMHFNPMGDQQADWLPLLPRLKEMAAKDPDGGIRSEVITRLGWCDEGRAFLKVLRDANAEPAPDIWLRLDFQENDPGRHARFCERTLVHLASPDERVRSRWLGFIGGQSNPSLAPLNKVEFNKAVLAQVLELTHSTSASERAMGLFALETLWKMDPGAVLQRMSEMTDDESADVRWRIAIVLKDQPNTPAARVILEKLLKDPSEQVRFFAILALPPERQESLLKPLAASADKKIAEMAEGRLQRLAQDRAAGKE